MTLAMFALADLILLRAHLQAQAQAEAPPDRQATERARVTTEQDPGGKGGALPANPWL